MTGVATRFFTIQPRTLAFLFVALLCFYAPPAAVAELSPIRRDQLTQIWQEEFDAPPLLADPFQQPSPQAAVRAALPNNANEYSSQAHLRSDQPHPAVARIVVPEAGATSYGSGTLVDVRDQFGLVITNWHVVRDAQGPVEVHFPGGFHSKARSLKVDSDWDLAALVVWRPPIQPVELATSAPQPGDQLTICGYGPGVYRSATGRCTQYYAPRRSFPQEMVELDVEARQGDSGGPIFNRYGELAGVLFGAGQGTTLGSFGGRVETFLATLAPDIGRATDDALLATAETPPADPVERSPPEKQVVCRDGVCYPIPSSRSPLTTPPEEKEPDEGWEPAAPQLAGMWATSDNTQQQEEFDEAGVNVPGGDSVRAASAGSWHAVPRHNWFAQIKTALAAVGLITVCMFMLKAVC